MVEVVLLTETGIVFCTATEQTLDELRVELQRTPDVIRLAVTVTDDQGEDYKYFVSPVNILIGSSRR